MLPVDAGPDLRPSWAFQGGPANSYPPAPGAAVFRCHPDRLSLGYRPFGVGGCRWGRGSCGDPKKIVIIAGPNGAGKTTFAHEYLPREAGCPDFINMDLIAAGLRVCAGASRRPGGPCDASGDPASGRAGESFAFETTLAGRQYARGIPQWRAAGYHVKLIFLRLPNVELALARVAARYSPRGHAVPAEVVQRRFDVGWHHFQTVYRSWLTVGSCTTPRGPSRSPSVGRQTDEPSAAAVP